MEKRIVACIRYARYCATHNKQMKICFHHASLYLQIIRWCQLSESLKANIRYELCKYLYSFPPKQHKKFIDLMFDYIEIKV